MTFDFRKEAEEAARHSDYCSRFCYPCGCGAVGAIEQALRRAATAERLQCARWLREFECGIPDCSHKKLAQKMEASTLEQGEKS